MMMDKNGISIVAMFDEIARNRAILTVGVEAGLFITYLLLIPSVKLTVHLVNNFHYKFFLHRICCICANSGRLQEKMDASRRSCPRDDGQTKENGGCQ